jgi:hypothetical protein
MATEVSGREVPIAIKVVPIISGDILILEASLSTNFRRKLADTTKNKSETANNMITCDIVLI